MYLNDMKMTIMKPIWLEDINSIVITYFSIEFSSMYIFQPDFLVVMVYIAVKNMQQYLYSMSFFCFYFFSL